MSGFFKRIAEFGRAMFGPARASGQTSVRNSGSAAAAIQQLQAAAPPQAEAAARAAFVITISKPEPLPQPALGAAADAAATKPAATKPATTVLLSHRHPASPLTVAKSHRKVAATTQRRAKPKPAQRTQIRSNRTTSDQVRMQAALMRCQRQRDAERALAKLKAAKPSAVVLQMARAA